MRIAICNVGDRDLRYKLEGRFLTFAEKELAEHLECEQGTRHVGAKALKLLERDENLSKLLAFPIIEPFLRHVVVYYGPIDHLVLAVTDQDRQTTPVHFWSRDTVNSGHILETLVQEAFGDDVGEVKLLHVYAVPNLVEDGYALFGEQLLRLLRPEEVSEVHILFSGGIPALNYGLTWQALNLYEKVCHIYQIVEPPNDELYGEVQRVRMLGFHRDLLKRTVRDLITQYEYSGALAVLEEQIGHAPLHIRNPLHSAALRLNLNFEVAADELATLHSSSVLLNDWYEFLRQPSDLDHLTELYWQVVVRKDQEAFADFLWRVATFYEKALRVLVATATGIEALTTESKIPMIQLRRQAADVYNYLPIRHYDEFHINVSNLLRICNVLCEAIEISDRQRWRDLYELIHPLHPLYELRNQLLHQVHGVSRRVIEDHIPLPDVQAQLAGTHTNADPITLLLALMRQIVHDLAVTMGHERPTFQTNPYDQINNHLVEQVQLWLTEHTAGR